MLSLLAATGNLHKLEEMRAILGGNASVLGGTELGLTPSPEETGNSFAENARIKADAWFRALMDLGQYQPRIDFIVGDDSGLEVDAIGGAPGVLSARFAASPGQKGNSPDADNNSRLLELLAGVPPENRAARFRCVLAVRAIRPSSVASEESILFEGTCEGRIAEGPLGSGGFGYDPLFIPDGFQESLACLGPEIKNRLSHRARALALMADYFRLRKSLT